MLPEPQQGAEVQMNTRGVGGRLYCYIYFISLFWMRFFQDVPTSVMFGMLSKIRKQRKNFVTHTRYHETGSSIELLSKEL